MPIKVFGGLPEMILKFMLYNTEIFFLKKGGKGRTVGEGVKCAINKKIFKTPWSTIKVYKQAQINEEIPCSYMKRTSIVEI